MRRGRRGGGGKSGRKGGRAGTYGREKLAAGIIKVEAREG